MKLLSPESLNDLQREILKNYSRFFPEGSVCVNVMLGAEPWDIRPLLLLRGKVSIARFSMTLSETQARAVVGEIEGFLVLSRSLQTIRQLPGDGRYMMLRPFEPSTLSEDLERGALAGRDALSDVVQQLIRLVSDLSRRSVAHGHISPANLALRNGELVLLDPMVGFLHRTTDAFLPPEGEAGGIPDPSADLYGLGRMIKILLGDWLTPRQSALVEQLLLSSPRQRPPLVEVAVAFGLQGDSPPVEVEPSPAAGIAGRVVRQGTVERIQPSRPSSVSPVQGADVLDPPKSVKPSGMPWILLTLAAVGGLMVVKTTRPQIYYDIACYVPFLAPEHSSEYESDWASRDRARMSVVARAAVVRHEPAAIQTIVSDILAGSNPDGVRSGLVRVALSDTWRAGLSKQDAAAALALGLQSLVPEGVHNLPPLESLHPGVLLAIVGSKQPLEQVKLLAKQPIEPLTRLPEPFGPLFNQLKGMGVSQLGDPRTAGLARIVTGDISGAAFEAFLGADTPAPQVLAKISTIMPVIAANEAGVVELLSILRDRGGDIATLVAWFEITDLARWSTFPAIDKLRLILNLPPEAPVNNTQWADLLTFPLEGARGQAIMALKARLSGASGERLLLTLASPAGALSREETVALVSALSLPDASQQPFVTAWFELTPAPDAVLLILLARASADSTDVFNLEAARYLRKNTWKASLDVLSLLADHPEPLARVLAYGRLDPTKGDERAVLSRREKKETDSTCLKALRERLAAR